MSLRAEALNGYLADGALLPFVFGERDCAIWVADWVKSQTGRDPALRLRGTFGCAFGSARIVRRGGGLVPLVGDLMARMGLPETEEPAMGDVGIVMAPAGELAGICTGTAWAVKAKDGLAVARLPVLKAWSV